MNRLRRFVIMFSSLLTLSVLLSFGITPPSSALTPTVTIQPTPPPSQAPHLIVTSIVGNSTPDYIELYNQGDDPISLANWSLAFTVHDDGLNGCADVHATIGLPQAWLLSKKYLTLEQTSTPATDSVTWPFAFDTTTLVGCVDSKLANLSLVDATGTAEQTLAFPPTEWSSTGTTIAQHKQRNNSPSSTRNLTNLFDSDYKLVTTSITLNSDPLYLPPVDASGLEILEVLANARSCSPTEVDPTCGDYIKLLNPTDQPINLAQYRLRAGYQGQAVSITNTFSWGQNLDPASDELDLPPGAYFTLTNRDDGQPLSLTDSGNYVWLEDAYDTTIYQPIAHYPDASSTSKAGWAWAYDGKSWRWTSAPAPNGANSFPTLPAPTDVAAATKILKPCDAGQYRNPATNRCKRVVAATSTLAPCQPGQFRNPATSRCRSIVTASTTLVPCQSGWERNPTTNRCRKAVKAVAGAATTSIKDVAAPMVDASGWFVAALVVALAASYGVYEWRQEIRFAVRTVLARTPFVKRTVD